MVKITLLGLNNSHVWNTETAFLHLKTLGEADTKRTAERRLHELALLPSELTAETLKDELDRKPNQVVLNWALEKSRSQRKLVLFTQLYAWPNGQTTLHANDARGGRYWVVLLDKTELTTEPYSNALQPLSAQPPSPQFVCNQAVIFEAINRLQQRIGKDIAVFPHGVLVGLLRDLPRHTSIYTSHRTFALCQTFTTRSTFTQPSHYMLAPIEY